MEENYPGRGLVESQPNEEDRKQGRHPYNEHDEPYSIRKMRQKAAEKFRGIRQNLEKI